MSHNVKRFTEGRGPRGPEIYAGQSAAPVTFNVLSSGLGGDGAAGVAGHKDYVDPDSEPSGMDTSRFTDSNATYEI